MSITALPDTDCSPVIPFIPAQPAAVSTRSGGPPLFDLSNNDFYTTSYVEILDKIEEVTNDVLFSGMVFPNVRAVHKEAQSKIGERFGFKVCLIGSALFYMNAKKRISRRIQKNKGIEFRNTNIVSTLIRDVVVCTK